MKINHARTTLAFAAMLFLIAISFSVQAKVPDENEIVEIDVQETKTVEETKTIETVEKVKAETRCHITFDLKGWSVFYKRAKGEGTIKCDNGQTSNVALSAHGGGITFGKQEIRDGHGTFSLVSDISKLFGSYASSEAHAGAKKSAAAQALTKGNVSLAFSGTGHGYDLGFSFGSLKITPIERESDLAPEEGGE